MSGDTIIIPDIHADFTKLSKILDYLKIHNTKDNHWENPDNLHLIFLGDLIDNGFDNTKVINTVRSLIDANIADCIMGNHELNAIHFYEGLRPNSDKNRKQHHTFLDEYGDKPNAWHNAIRWMKSLPVFIETNHFIAIHAYYDRQTITKHGLESNKPLNENLLLELSNETKHSDIVSLMKGLELSLPNGL